MISAWGGELNALMHKPQPQTITLTAMLYWEDINLVLSLQPTISGLGLRGAGGVARDISRIV